MRLKTLAAVLTMALLPAPSFAQSPPPQSTPEARAKVRAACAVDVQKHCANVERGKGAMRACLEANEKQLSDGCRAARAERAAMKAKEKG